MGEGKLGVRKRNLGMGQRKPGVGERELAWERESQRRERGI